MPLSDAAVRNAKPRPKPYKLSDSAGLYLQVQPNGSKLWRQLKRSQLPSVHGRYFPVC